MEAYISLRIDIDNNEIKGLREYARIWNWSRKKVQTFFKSIGFKVGDTRETLRRQQGDTWETPYRLLIFDLEEPKRQKGDTKETLRSHYYNTNTNTNIKYKIEFREKKFIEAVFGFNNYPKDMLKEFCDYWTEKNKSGTKMRFELEQTWDLSKRLSRWSNSPFRKKDEKQKPKSPYGDLVF